MKNLKLRLNLRNNKNRYDNFNLKFYYKIQKGFISMAKNKKNYMIINSNTNIPQNKRIIINKINNLLAL